LAHRLLGQVALQAGDAQTALDQFTTALEPYPDNLGERKHLNWPDADLHYYAGLAKQQLGDVEGAKASFDAVLANRGGLSEAGYYQGLALIALGRARDGTAHFQSMLDEAAAQLDAQARQGYATSVPQFVFVEADSETQRRIHLTYIIGLAHLGLGHRMEAEKALQRVLALEPNHLGAQEALKQVA
jgi:tetratricopeptide (TPR) repeat protein